MSKTRNLCAKIPEELHARAREEQEELGVTLNGYVKENLEEHCKKKGGKGMSGNTGTIAFQIQDELFDRLKAYPAANKLTQDRLCGTD